MASFMPSTDFAVDLAGNMSTIVSSYLPEAKTSSWAWASYVSLLVATMYVYDSGTKMYRDRKMRKFGSPPPVVPYRAPLGQFWKRCSGLAMTDLVRP